MGRTPGCCGLLHTLIIRKWSRSQGMVWRSYCAARAVQRRWDEVFSPHLVDR